VLAVSGDGFLSLMGVRLFLGGTCTAPRSSRCLLGRYLCTQSVGYLWHSIDRRNGMGRSFLMLIEGVTEPGMSAHRKGPLGW
jgi:hypothetical protein